MSTLAAVMTGQGTGAIATIQIFGDSAKTIIKKIFKPAGAKPVTLKPGKILLGTISNGNKTIDQVTLGCEGPKSYAINCHGNPLVVEMIIELLGQNGAQLVSTEELLVKILAEECTNTIELEARLVQLKAQTIEGAKIIANQITDGLNTKARKWLQGINEIPLDEIKADAEQILKNSRTSRLIINGCKAVIAGPPNTGKSTLLNCLCGKTKAIVTDIKGTTRDWVSAQFRLERLSLELIDTAGLNENPATISESSPEELSQQKTAEILEEADLVLLVLDRSQSENPIDKKLLEKIADKKVLTVLNKCDLPAKFDAGKLPGILSKMVQISAKFGTGIENLLKKILQICGVADFDLHSDVCVTGRQESLLRRLQKAKSKQQVASIITELLNAQVQG